MFEPPPDKITCCSNDSKDYIWRRQSDSCICWDRHVEEIVSADGLPRSADIPKIALLLLMIMPNLHAEFLTACR